MRLDPAEVAGLPLAVVVSYDRAAVLAPFYEHLNAVWPTAVLLAVVIALGTVETTRVALTTFQQSLAGRAAQRMGTNLIAHLRSNLTIRVPRAAIAASAKERSVGVSSGTPC